MMLSVKPYLCSGCRSCEMACAFLHAKTKGRASHFPPGVDPTRPSAWENESGVCGLCSPGLPRVKVSVASGSASSIPMLCLQCDSARCMAACAYGALVRSDSTGAIEVVPARCTRCLLCTMACPFGNIELDAATNEVVKCDICKGDPACAKFCPTGALVFEIGR